ncbi:MAG TPA: phytase [Cellvibrio sp.]|nr:phytase [Cellvibrio sp.]
MMTLSATAAQPEPRLLNTGKLAEANLNAVIAPLNINAKPSRLLATSTGVFWLDTQGKPLASFPQGADSLDIRSNIPWQDNKRSQSLVVAATILQPEQQAAILALDPVQKTIRELVRLPIANTKISSVCLSLDKSQHLSLFVMDERGTAQHWLVMTAEGKPVAKHLRDLPVPPNAKSCSVDDTHETLFVAEESVGIWAYSANMEADSGRRAVDMAAPFGQLQKGSEGIAALPQGLLAIEPQQKQLKIYSVSEKESVLVQSLDISAVAEPEAIKVGYDEKTQSATVLIYDDKNGRFFSMDVPWQTKPNTPMPIVNITPDIQTDVMARFGDAADDPAIWINKDNPQASRVIGTNKQQGLFIYDLSGKEVQHFNSGKLNNVDVRQGVNIDGRSMDIVVATNRDSDSLEIFSVNPDTGELTPSGNVATDLKEIYGFCLYHSPANPQQPQGALYAIPNAKSGEFQQLQLTATADKKGGLRWRAKKMRSFFVGSQPEGCVADEQQRRLFIGEEDVGVWTIGAEPNDGTRLSSLAKISETLVDDVEGMGIYYGKSRNYLVVSSQGNNTYVVYDSLPPFKYRGAFSVVLDAGNNVDGTSETDGLEVTSVNLGSTFSEGMLVVQDGHKVMPEAPQNFKYISWEKIRKALNLE